MGIGNAFPFLHLMPVFAASESGVLGSSGGTAETPLCERCPCEPSVSQSWSLSAWG